MRDSWRLVLKGLLVVLAVTASAVAQPNDAPPPSIQYIPVWLPEHLRETLPNNYVPIAREDFDKDVAAQTAVRQSSTQASSFISAALFAAVYEDHLLQDGIAWLDVEHSSPHPSWLELGDLGFAVANLNWFERLHERPLFGSGPRPTTELSVTESGRLMFDWSAAGRSSAGRDEFDLRFPAAVMRRMVLITPNGYTPSCRGSVVQQVNPEQALRLVETNEQLADRFLDRLRDEDYTTWLVEFSAESHPLLVASVGAGDSPAPTRYRQFTQYHIRRSGLEFSTELSLHVEQTNLASISLRIDPSLHVSSVSLPGKRLETERVDPSTLLVRFPEQLNAGVHKLGVVALGSLVLDRRWNMPTLSPTAQRWEEATTVLAVDDGLVLRDLVSRQCEPTAATQRVESALTRQFQMFGPEAQISILVAPRQQTVEVAAGTTIVVEPDSITATVVADLHSPWSDLYKFEVKMPNWLSIDVETVPAEALHGFELLSGRVLVKLARPVAPGKPLRVLLHGTRASSAAGQQVHPGSFLPQFYGDVRSSLVSLVANPPYQFSFTGSAARQIVDATLLASAQRDRIQIAPGGAVFSGSLPAGVSLVVPTSPPRLRAHSEVSLVVGERSVVESFQIQCTPVETPVKVMSVVLPGHDDSIRWTVIGDDDLRIESVKPLGDEWQIVLNRAAAGPFTLSTEADVGWEDHFSARLPTIPSADVQAGRVVVRNLSGNQLSIGTSLDPVPSPVLGLEADPTVVGSYRFESADDAQVTVYKNEYANENGSIVIWSSRLMTQLAESRNAIHDLVLKVENHGARSLRIEVPITFAVESVIVDGQELTGNTPTYTELRVGLDPAKRFSTVHLRCFSTNIELGLYSSVEIPVPRPVAPVIRRDWTLWIPPSYRLVEQDNITLSNPQGARNRSGLWSLLANSTASGQPQDRRQANVQQESWVTAQFLSVARREHQQADTQLQWKSLLEAFEKRLVTANFDSLLIDSPKLIECGLSPTSPVDLDMSGPDASIDVLARYGLAFKVIGTSCVLTTRRASVFWDRPDANQFSGNTARRLDPSQPDATAVGPAARLDSGLIGIADWNSLPRYPVAPWTRTPSRVFNSANHFDWVGYSIAIDESPVLRVQAYRPLALTGLGWSCFFGLAGLIACWPRLHLRQIVLVLGAIAALHCLVGPNLSLITTCAVLGTLLGTLVRVAVGRMSQTSCVSELPAIRYERAAQLSVLPWLIAIWLSPQPALAQAPVREATKIYKLVNPVDSEGKPVGDSYFMSEEFFLHRARLAKYLQATSQGWLYIDADYRATLDWSAPGTELIVDELNATLTVQVLKPNQEIRIPYALPEAAAPETWIDGIRVTPRQVAGALAFLIEETGMHYLELKFQPRVEDVGEEHQVSFAVPPIPQARLTLRAPVDSVRIVGARGATTSEREGTSTTALGAIDRLTFRWPANMRDRISGSVVDVEQYSWLHVEPGSVRLDSRFRFDIRGGSRRNFELQVDPRLRVKLSDRRELIDQSSITFERPDRIRFALKEAVTGEFDVQATCNTEDSSGVGRVPLPRFASLTGNTTRHWLGVTWAAQLEANPSETDAPMPVFMDAWKEKLIPPRRAYRLRNDEVQNWYLETSVRPAEVLAAEAIRLDLTSKEIEFEYAASISTTSGDSLSHRFRLPAEAQIATAELHESNGTVLPLRLVTRSGQAMVLLERPQQKPYRVTLSGTIPLTLADAARQGFKLPRISLEDATITDVATSIYRDDSVHVEVVSKELSNVSQIASQTDPRGDRRHLQSFTLFAEEVSILDGVTLRVRRNQPEFQRRFVTELERTQDGWRAHIDCEIKVVKGFVDAIGLHLPTQIAPPIRLETLVPHDQLPSPTQDGTWLIVTPPEAVSDSFRLRFSANIEIDPTQNNVAPNVMPLDPAAHDQHYVVLPKRIDKQTINWETRGLTAADWPAYDSVLRPAEASCFAVTGAVGSRRSYQAIVKSIEQFSDEPAVQLAEYRVALQPASKLGLACFDLSPSRAKQMTLVIPDGITIERLSVAGVQVPVGTIEGGETRINLGSYELPQRIEVLFRQAAGQKGGQLQLVGPRLQGIPVRRTAWSISSPALVRGSADIAAKQVTRQVFETTRTETVNETVASAANVVAESPLSERANWYRIWLHRLVEPLAHIVRLNETHSDADIPRADDLLQEQKNLAARLELASDYDAAIENQQRATTPGELFGIYCEEDARVIYFIFDGDRPSIEARLVSSQSAWLARSLYACLALLAAVLIYSLCRHAIVTDLVLQSPLSIGVATGIVLLLWLPSAWLLGAAVAGVSLLTALRPWLQHRVA